MTEYRVTVPVKANTLTEAARLVGEALGFDQLSINDVGGLEVIEVNVVSDETPFLVCRNCGEAFDSITPAHEHGPSDLSGSAGWCGDDGFDIVPESEAY